MNPWSDADTRFMRRAIEVSKQGFPVPNPHVGCVLVQDDRIIGEGFHHHAGAAHAEVDALARATESPAGSTAFVTLEPCNHQGRTGPCSLALIEAGVARVVYAVPDPNPRAVGGGERLREAGIQVECGLLAEEASAANRQFLFAIEHKRPLVVLKAACSLDGRIALPSGESQWITGEAARLEGHRLRAELGAVLVGRRTVEVDDPELTARIPDVVNQPLRVVLDPSQKLTGGEKVFNERAETLWVRWPFELDNLLADLFSRGVTGLLVEGGSRTHASFLRAGFCDELHLFVAPKVLGDGPAWVEGLDLPSLASSMGFELKSAAPLGADLHMTLAPLARNGVK